MDEKRAAELRRKIAHAQETGDHNAPECYLNGLEYELFGPDAPPSGNLDDAAKRIAGMIWKYPRHFSELIAQSEHDWLAWRTLEYTLARIREKGDLVPEPLMSWALDVAQGSRECPKRRPGRSEHENSYRDLLIGQTVELIRFHSDLPATSETHTRSICHLIAPRVNLDYERVRQIWRKHRRLLIRFERAGGPRTAG